MVGEYRKAALDGFTYNDLVEYGYDDGKVDLVPADTVETIIDRIESDISDIRHMLEDIKGLTEIDEITERVNQLEEKLY